MEAVAGFRASGASCCSTGSRLWGSASVPVGQHDLMGAGVGPGQHARSYELGQIRGMPTPRKSALPTQQPGLSLHASPRDRLEPSSFTRTRAHTHTCCCRHLGPS